MAQKLEFVLTRYPEPILRQVAEPVVEFDAGLAETVQAMFELMYRSQGVGLAAPQVGLGKRILVLDPAGDREADDSQPIVLVNPRLVETSGTPTVHEEGCLSFPGIFAEVRRPERCKVQAYGLDGQPFEADYDGFTSRIVQHEYDHLEGVLLVDRMSPADRQRHKAALQELVERFKATRDGGR
jgi:peptide deformylase